MKFLKCDNCDVILGYVGGKNTELTCCGAQVKELVANTVEASQEKHIPVVTVNDNIVTINVGSVEHPMSEEHHIAWVAIETNEGFQRKNLNFNGMPIVQFALVNGDKVKSAYAYCNLHGLWRADV